MKKRVTAFLAAVAMVCTSTTAYAHDSDVFAGKYTTVTKADFYVRIHSSALNSVYSFDDVYMYGEEWNKMSSNVDLYVMSVGESVSIDPNQINVIGENIKSANNGLTLGIIEPHDRYGKKCEVHDDWGYCDIKINNTYEAQNYLLSKDDTTTAARKVFLHELGHALKLAHPVQSTTHRGNNAYNQYPYAIMNNGGLDGTVCASNTITTHDKLCLIAKWGK